MKNINTINLKTKIILGGDSLDELPNLLHESNARKILVVYGEGSIKRNGIYEKLITILKNKKIIFGEFPGIEPNPRHSTIDKAVKIVKKEKYDFILGVGGGSVIDATKIIATCASHNWSTCWDLIMKKVQISNEPMNCGAITTISGTASENNDISVVSNHELKEKYSAYTKPPIFAILNPEFTFSVNNWQTASGGFDCFSHILEQYYGAKEFDFTDNITFALLRTLIDNVAVALKNPTNYFARENIMITSAFGLNRILYFKANELGGDWMVHALEHSVSALWDVTHGAGLALITPYYLRWAISKSAKFKHKTQVLGKNIFNVSSAEQTIEKMEKLIINWGLPRKLSQFKGVKNISNSEMKHLVHHTSHRGALNLSNDDIQYIFKSIPE